MARARRTHVCLTKADFGRLSADMHANLSMFGTCIMSVASVCIQLLGSLFAVFAGCMSTQLSSMTALVSGLACVRGVCRVAFALIASLKLLVQDVLLLLGMLCSVSGGVCVSPSALLACIHVLIYCRAPGLAPRRSPLPSSSLPHIARWQE